MDSIRIIGARENNLKNVSVDLPKGKLIIVTGLSGSGKSSLVYDTIYAEGQRRYLGSLSSDARQYINQLDKPEVDKIEGLSPTLAIDQRQGYINPRDTVGTMTDVHDYFRILYSGIGLPNCIHCGSEIKAFSPETINLFIKKLQPGTRYALLSPVLRNEEMDFKKLFKEIQHSGYNRVRLDGRLMDISDNMVLEKGTPHDLDIVVDRLIAGDHNENRLGESIEACIQRNKKKIILLIFNNDTIANEQVFNLGRACNKCDIEYSSLPPRAFSFNNPHGACSKCSGVGSLLEFNPDKVIPDKSLSFNEGAIVTINPKANWQKSIFNSLANHYNFDLDTSFNALPEHIINIILYGSDDELDIEYTTNAKKNKYEYSASYKGVLNDLKKRYMESQSEETKRWLETFMDKETCSECKGKRLKPESLAVTICGKNIHEMMNMSVSQLIAYVGSMNLEGNEKLIANEPLAEIRKRLEFLEEVGLGYLTLDRKSTTLSGGEYQRIRLATQIGSALDGVIYILDEPTIGLHPRDNDKLINSIVKLKEFGNTVIVVEHDEQTIRKADHIVDMGPGAGIHGGEILFTGSLNDMLVDSNSITGPFLNGTEKVESPNTVRRAHIEKIILQNAYINNLKHIDIEIPLGVLIAVTGVSGSGKSSLIIDTLYPAIRNKLTNRKHYPANYGSITGHEQVDSIVYVDQSPVGRSPRSNPATYMGFFDSIRELFAMSPESRMRGFKSGRFSFNKDEGRCENCKGMGKVAVKMHFLPDIYILCDSCKGKQYNQETLSVLYNNKNIFEVLQMSVSEALAFFEKHPHIHRPLTLLNDIGLGYLKLGQSSTTLSGGESQRIKLADELCKNKQGHTLYLLDEPTTGLHFRDINSLMRILHRLVDQGNTVLTIEHNLDVIKQADYIIDMGPEGGDTGGEVLFQGTVEDLKHCGASYTAKYL